MAELNTQAVAVYLLGAALGIIIPYSRKWLEEGIPFDGRKVAGKVLTALAGLLLAPTFGDVVAQLGGMGLLLAFASGLAATWIGHEAQSLPAAFKARSLR